MWLVWIAGGLASLVGAGYLFDSTIGKSKLITPGKTSGDKTQPPPKDPPGNGWLIGVVLSVLAAAGGAVWFFMKKKPGGANNRALFNMGYMGMTATEEEKRTDSYLAGMAKRLRDDSRAEQFGKMGQKLGGLEITNIQAEFGKPRWGGGGYRGEANYRNS